MALARGQNLVAWWRRIAGAQDLREPEILPTIQPVVLIGNHADLVPPLNVAVGHFGLAQAGGAATFPIFEIQCRAPGGAHVDVHVEFDNPFADIFLLYSFFAAPSTITAPVTWPARLPDAARPVASVVRSGTTPAGAPLLDPALGYPIHAAGQANATGGPVRSPLPTRFWLPAGRCAVFQGVNAPDQTFFGTVVLREIPALAAS